jgi:hypothetical protein
MIRITLARIALIALAGLANAQPLEAAPITDEIPTAGSEAIEYRNASGDLIGTAITIGGTTYLAAPDGEPIGTLEMVDGRRVLKMR